MLRTLRTTKFLRKSKDSPKSTFPQKYQISTQNEFPTLTKLDHLKTYLQLANDSMLLLYESFVQLMKVPKVFSLDSPALEAY